MFSHYNVDSSIVVSSGWLCATITIPHALFCQLVIAQIPHILGLGLWQWIICELCVLLNSTRGSARSTAVLFRTIWQGAIYNFYWISELNNHTSFYVILILFRDLRIMILSKHSPLRTTWPVPASFEHVTSQTKTCTKTMTKVIVLFFFNFNETLQLLHDSLLFGLV